MIRIPAVITENIVIIRNLMRGGLFNTAGLGFAAYIVAICYPGLTASSGQLMDLRSGVVSMADVGDSSLYIAVPSMLLGLLVFSRHGLFAAIYRGQPILMFLLIFSSLVIFMSIIGVEFIQSSAQIVQYAVTVGCFILCLSFWQARDRDVDDALAMAFLALAGCLIAAAAVQGFHDYRWVGLIHPNHYARYAYIALLLHSLVVRRVSLLVFIPCFAAAYVVSARTVMIGMILFYLGFAAISHFHVVSSRARQMMTARILAFGLMALPVAVLGVLLFADTDGLFDKVMTNLAIFDPDRGIFSGFTGRSDTWAAFFTNADQYVLFGYGFRSSRYGLHVVHSGILSYFMDFGLVLGGILLAAVLSRGVYLVTYGIRREDWRALLCGLGVVTTLIIQWFEPDNFNIGFIGAFFFMLALAFIPPMLPSEASRPLMRSARRRMAPVSGTTLRLTSETRSSRSAPAAQN